TVRVNFNADTIGDFVNFVYFIPVSGVSKVEGALVGIWGDGPDENFFSGIHNQPVDPTFDGSEEIVLDPILDLSEAVYSVDQFTGADAVWTLSGGPVVVRVLGIHIEVDDRDGDDLSETPLDVEYRFTIEPKSGAIADPDPAPEPQPDPIPDPDPAPDPVPGPAPAPDPVYIVNDILVSETHTGGDGVDTFYAVGDREDFSFDFLEDGRIIITDSFFPDAPDTLIGIERIELFDGWLAFDTDGNAGQSYRLYQAAFDRTPDAEGLGFWIDHFDDGNVDLVAMAGFFMQSEEFAQRYGDPNTLSDRAFLDLLYANVLDRTSDQAGFDFWSAQQAAGLSRPEMLQYFSESVENYDNVAASIDMGIFYV
ncbi:MAG: DUF4214 domain-containing protein, partial [Sulfitobacter sp.]